KDGGLLRGREVGSAPALRHVALLWVGCCSYTRRAETSSSNGSKTRSGRGQSRLPDLTRTQRSGMHFAESSCARWIRRKRASLPRRLAAAAGRLTPARVRPGPADRRADQQRRKERP